MNGWVSSRSTGEPISSTHTSVRVWVGLFQNFVLHISSSAKPAKIDRTQMASGFIGASPCTLVRRA